MFCTYGEFSRISIVVTILCIFFPHYLVAEQYIPFFCDFYQSSLCPLQSHKTSEQRNTICNSNNSDNHDNRKEPVLLSIAPDFNYSVQLPQNIFLNPFIKLKQRDADKLLFMMRGNGSLGSRHFKTSHSSSRRRNTDNASSEGEFIEV